MYQTDHLSFLSYTSHEIIYIQISYASHLQVGVFTVQLTGPLTYTADRTGYFDPPSFGTRPDQKAIEDDRTGPDRIDWSSLGRFTRLPGNNGRKNYGFTGSAGSGSNEGISTKEGLLFIKKRQKAPPQLVIWGWGARSAAAVTGSTTGGNFKPKQIEERKMGTIEEENDAVEVGGEDGGA